VQGIPLSFSMHGDLFTKYIPVPEKGQAAFDQLLKLFQQLLMMTSGNAQEALEWLTELDKRHQLTNEGYGIGDFIREMEERGFLKREEGNPNSFIPTAKIERSIRQQSLEDIFGKLKKTQKGNHKTKFSGAAEENSGDVRSFQFGDSPEQIAVTESIRNAYANHGIEDFQLLESDLEIREAQHLSQSSTVLMIDISHSMILYGEDRITPAKQVAMALSELIMTRYPKDTLDIIVFGNDAWEIEVKDLPYLNVGPYHTNTVAGLELAMDILRRRKNPNKHIFMITDGKPTCLKEGDQYYKNSFGLDRKIMNKCYSLAAQCRRAKIPVTTFMIARDPYLQKFVEEFTEVNKGKAFYTSLNGLGDFIFADYESNKRKRVR
jgi:Ca-activated chloride channel homolog